MQNWKRPTCEGMENHWLFQHCLINYVWKISPRNAQKSFHWRFTPHQPSIGFRVHQYLARVGLSKQLLSILQRAEQNNFHSFATEDKSWFCSSSDRNRCDLSNEIQLMTG
jgi:hypothetical protein